ncbi:unnamed protein product [Rotaria sp. Silwood1]|nr:unnamed protein product [Rotaria sp. Silwood1]CAF0914069.1 unnamed protein product [Rotaria sp. Silwood1]CAF0940657.1 unnamed protein product [Rotaria sp. Silwood1]CAF3374091.1 unnamed protein product [Rotaria sp. Silwood1]CAF3392870.1 unnamed protein product [Rotaria sp. Silwood1]
MDFEVDPLIVQIARKEKKETFGLIICALFHQPKPIQFAHFYHQLIEQLEANFNEDEKQSIYIYPIAHLHITISTLYNFKDEYPQSPEKCLKYWKECFIKLKQTTKKKSIILTLDSIHLSKDAGYFQYKDENNGMEYLRQLIHNICIPEDGKPPLKIPNIVHTSFLRFIKKPNDPIKFEEKFHRICHELLKKTNEIRFDIDEICLAFEARPYMHIDCDEFHILDTMKC